MRPQRGRNSERAANKLTTMGSRPVSGITAWANHFVAYVMAQRTTGEQFMGE